MGEVGVLGGLWQGVKVLAGEGRWDGPGFLSVFGFCSLNPESDLYYSTKVRVCDRMAENLIFVGRDPGLGIRVLGGWNGLFG